ncbi:universal stress protein [Natronobiforma cellulositropha]|uniref:universal stress protein n=1 Tax=Natronobiforma cellulositropha TaxID=1679076 RepID=UPI0021D5EB92|nr:universal stress protein [Natronobiforma cellulositropha]
MYRILLPVDGSETRAAAQVEAVTKLSSVTEGISVEILHVHEQVRGVDAEWAAGGFAETYAEAMRESVRDTSNLPDSVDLVAESLESAGIEHAVQETRGEPAEAILEIAADHEVDCIVISARKRSPIGKVLFGSVAQAVILDSECPVTVVAE